MPRKLTNYNKYIKNKLLMGYSLSESAALWNKYKNVRKGSRSGSRHRHNRKSHNPHKSIRRKRRVGSRSTRRSRRVRYMKASR